MIVSSVYPQAEEINLDHNSTLRCVFARRHIEARH